jgi:hypothetical protein
MTDRTSRNHDSWEHVRKEKDPAKAIRMAADVGEDAIRASIEDRDLIRADIHEIRRLVAGNGDPTHSIIARVERIEMEMATTCNVVAEIRRLLVGDLTGKKDTISDKVDDLGDRIDKIEGQMASINKLTWAVIIIVVGEFFARIFNLI